MTKLNKKINWKILNISIYITLIIGYIFPFECSINNSVLIGWPLHFFTIYNNIYNGINLLTSCYLSIGHLLINILFYYFLLVVITKLIFYKNTWREKYEKTH